MKDFEVQLSGKITIVESQKFAMSDRSEADDDSESDYSGEDSDEYHEHEEPTEEQGLLMCELIKRVGDANKKAQESGGKEGKVLLAGEFLLSDVKELHPSAAAQEEYLIKCMNVIVMAMESNSDYRAYFWEASNFFQLVIESYSTTVVLETVKACVSVFNSEHNAADVCDGWARAATKRCAQLIHLESTEEILSIEVLKRVKEARTILDKVSEAGYVFQDVIKAEPELKDSLAELNLMLVQAPTNSSVFSAVNKKAAAALKKEVLCIESMSSDSAEGTLIALEQSVDLTRPTGAPFLEAYNAMCEHEQASLDLQVRAAQGPLAKLAVQALFTQNEHNQGKKDLFGEALSFIKLLLEPWDRENAAHMETKLQIATSLLELDVVTGLLKHFSFWVEHKFGYGDSCEAAVVSLLELIRHFPNLIGDKILPDAGAVTFIRYLAEVGRTSTIYRSRVTGERAAGIIEALMDGKPEPALITKRKAKGIGAKARG